MVKTSTNSFSTYVEVIVNSAIDKQLDYGVPEKLYKNVDKGSCVYVSLRGKRKIGIVLKKKTITNCSYVLPILGTVQDNIKLSNDLIQLALWISAYYFSPLGKVLKFFFPSGIKNNVQEKMQYFIFPSKKNAVTTPSINIHFNSIQKKLLSFVKKNSKQGVPLTSLINKFKISRSPVTTLIKNGFLIAKKSTILPLTLDNANYIKTEKKTLNHDQKKTFDNLLNSLQSNSFHSHLLFGVTGSGKTEIYLQIIEEAKKLGKSSIVLVPEIMLTTQILEQFKSRFNDGIGILHYKISEKEKKTLWLKAINGEINIIIGARSALFCPLKNLGLIIVDEEHDSSYKQTEEMPCYQTRDVAVMRGKLIDGLVILGSATPSLESYTNALNKKYSLSILPKKISTSAPLKIHIINMNEEREKNKTGGLFASFTLKKIREKLEAKEQGIIFLNRRGYHTLLSCSSCNHVFKCINCDISLICHLKDQSLSCHLCNYKVYPLPTHCYVCHSSTSLKYHGIGTEKIEAALKKIFPNILLFRVDSDTTKEKGSHAKILREFRSGKANFLIGTQMIAKGLHFPGVTLVVVLNSDTGLHIPDFRASEQVFQLITQVSGRSGRGLNSGEVILQTFSPNNDTIRLASEQNYIEFYNKEIESRELFQHPPFYRLVKFVFMGEDESLTRIKGEEFHKHISNLLRKKKDVIVLPLIASGYAKVKNLFRYQFLIKCKNIFLIRAEVKTSLISLGSCSKIKILIDVEPHFTFF